MTWWEVEQIAVYISSLDEAMMTWNLTTAQMRNEQIKLERLTGRLDKQLTRITDTDKKQQLDQLKHDTEQLQEQLQERLKRPISDKIQTRN